MKTTAALLLAAGTAGAVFVASWLIFRSDGTRKVDLPPTQPALLESSPPVEPSHPTEPVVLDLGDESSSEQRTDAPAQTGSLVGSPNASTPAEDFSAIRLEQLQRLRSAFQAASGLHDANEFRAGHRLLLTAIIARMDVEGRFTPMPPGGERSRGSRPGELNVYSGKRRYVINLAENPSLAQMQEAEKSANEPDAVDQKLARASQMLVLSEDQRADIVRAFDLAMGKLNGPR